MGTERLSALLPRYETKEENGQVKDHLRERQMEGLEEVLPMEMEEEMEGDFILRPLQKEIKEIGRRRNGQYLQVIEEEAEMFPFLPLQYKNCHIELPTLLLPLKIDFLWIGGV